MGLPLKLLSMTGMITQGVMSTCGDPCGEQRGQ